MGRISAAHTAGLDLVDKLFFNQILVHCFFTEELVWLNRLDTDVDHEMDDRGITGHQRQLVKHSVLCLLEASLSDSLLLLQETYPDKLPPLPASITPETYEKVAAHEQTLFQGIVLGINAALHGGDSNVVCEIVDALVGRYRSAPVTARYRLVERMFAFEFMRAPIDCFAWLLRMEVLSSDKYAKSRLKFDYPAGFLARLALLCEFDMQRDYVRRMRPVGGPKGNIDARRASQVRQLSRQMRELLLNIERTVANVDSDAALTHSFPFISIGELDNAASVRRFFAAFNRYEMRLRVFHGSLSSWTGMLCGGVVEVLVSHGETKRPIFTGYPEDDSLANFVASGMSGLGFAITPRVVYDRHRDFKETVQRAVATYYRQLLVQNVAIPPHTADLTYESLAPHFELFRASPRRGTGRAAAIQDTLLPTLGPKS